ncbi:hypothetical protein P692DRAFT_20828246, partial [Suillus brevipes Sb2]
GPCSIRVIEGAVTPRACTARPKRIDLFQHSSIYASLHQEHLGNRIGNSCQNRQRLELSWSSSSPMRTLEVATQYSLHPIKGPEAGMDTMTRSLTPPTSPTRSHPSLKYDLRLK